MKNKFAQPVSMQVTKEQFEYLAGELEKLGYSCGFKGNKYSSHIVTNSSGVNHHYSASILPEKFNRYFIPNYNPELFLALAAMREGDEPNLWEWFICLKTEGNYIKGEFSNEGFGVHYLRENWRKSTKSELIEHFTKQKEEEFKVGDCVVTSAGRIGIISEILSNGNCMMSPSILLINGEGNVDIKCGQCSIKRRATPEEQSKLEKAHCEYLAEKAGIKIGDSGIFHGRNYCADSEACVFVDGFSDSTFFPIFSVISFEYFRSLPYLKTEDGFYFPLQQFIDNPIDREEVSPDNVNHPSHYTPDKVECIDAIESATKELTGLDAFCTANAIKYLWRWKQKNGVEDLKKAQWYINKLINKQ